MHRACFLRAKSQLKVLHAGPLFIVCGELMSRKTLDCLKIHGKWLAQRDAL